MSYVSDPNVETTFAEFPSDARAVLDELRLLILNEASELGVDIEECLRWGQPSYLSPKGSMLRLGVAKTGDPAIFAHCQTTIISDFAAQFGNDFQIEGNRAVLFPDPRQIQSAKLRLLIAHALQYKLKRA